MDATTEIGKKEEEVVEEDAAGPYTLVGIDQVSGTTDSDEVPHLVCPCHFGNALEYYCGECETALCAECTNIEHIGHPTVTVREAIEVQKLEQLKLITQVREQVPMVEDSISIVKEVSKSLEQKVVEVEQQISNVFNELSMLIDERKCDLLLELSKTYTSKQVELKEQRDALESFLNKIHKSCSFKAESLNHTNETEILLVMKEMNRKLEELGMHNLDFYPEHNDFLFFDDNSVQSLKKLLCTLGALHTNNAVAYETTASGEGLLQCYTDRPSLVTITTKDRNGELVKLGYAPVMAVITGESSGEPLHPTVSDNRDGTYDVTYTLRNEGKHRLELKIFDQHIKGSPFKVKCLAAEDEAHATGGSSKITSTTAVKQTNTKRPSSSGSPGSTNQHSNPIEDEFLLKAGVKGRNKDEFTNPQGLCSSNGKALVADSNNQASNEDQGQVLKQSAENYWLQCIKAWYPELHTQTYFLPPLHFNRVPYSMENIAGEQVLVAQIPQDGPSRTPSTAKSRSRKQKRQTMSSSAPNPSGPLETISQVNLLLRPVYDSDVRDDKALECVLHCLRALADNIQQKEVMMVISQLQFGKYLGEPSYAATAALLPRPKTLPEHLLQQHYHEGDFDVLIIHRQYGLFTLEIKSVGANFSKLKMTEQQEDDALVKKVKEALKQLSKSEVVLKHLTSDLADNNITKILVMPNISSTQLLRAISRNPSDGQGLCQCLGVRSVDDALKMCLLSNQLSDKRTASDVNHIDLEDLGVWWQQLVKMSRAQPSITETVYEHLLARFCGPATTVEVHCVTAPRLDIRFLGEAVSATGETMARLVLFPQQVELLNRSPPWVFLIGPPGTGKTIVLIVQGLTWLRLGYDVHVVSTCSASRAATIAIEHQLKETMKTTTASSRVHRHQFDFWEDEFNRRLKYLEKDREVETAVRRLKSLSEGRQLCVIADEIINDYRKPFTEFCDKLILQVPGVYLWGASVHHEDRPLCLEEVKLTTPLRSPPVVVREVMESREIKFKVSLQVLDYTVSDVPVPTDGPAVIRFTHSEGQSRHTEFRPRDCVECGHEVARVLTELNVGRTGNSNGPPPLQYRDVLVLCDEYPTDDRVDNNGQVTTTASGLVRGLRACHVPVRVVKRDGEAAICDMALDVGDLVTVTDWGEVQGLERKVVVVENSDVDYCSQRLYAMSRCTSQLVLIDWHNDECDSSDENNDNR